MTNEIDSRVARAAAAFNESARELTESMLAKLESEAPETRAKVEQALNQGERMLLALEMSIPTPAIWWSTIDDYQGMKRIMTIPARVAARH